MTRRVSGISSASMDSLLEFALLVKAGQRELERRANEVMRPLGLTGAQADAITVIDQAGPLSLKELGELLIAESGHPSRLVDRLVDAGFVERRPAEDDRRRIVLSLTARGRRLAKRVEAAREQLLELGHVLLGDRDLTATLELMRELVNFTPYADLVARRRELASRGVALERSSKTGVGAR
jgi:MarR family transcriptional regulator, organic hydroperoxide resistance regulator